MLEYIGTLPSLRFLESLLAIDNLLSFAFLIHQTPKEKRNFVKKFALTAALILRLLLLGIFIYAQGLHHELGAVLN